MDERRRDTERERERRGSETDVPKLYPTMNVNSLCTEDPIQMNPLVLMT